MSDYERFTALLKDAEDKKGQSDLDGAVRDFEAALRIVTPDDSEIDMVIGLKDSGMPFRGISEYPNTDRMDSHIRSELVEILRELRRFDEAYHHARIAQYLDELLDGRNSNDNAADLLDLGLIELERGHAPEAEKWFGKSREVDDVLLRNEPDQWRTKWRQLTRAGKMESWGRLSEAAEAVLTILPDIQDKLSPYQVVQALNDGAQCLQNLGEHGRAQALLEQAIERQLEVAPGHPQLGRLYSNMAFLLHERLDFAGADHYSQLATQFGRYPHEVERQVTLPGQLTEDRARLDDWRRTSQRYFGSGGSRRKHDIFLSFNTKDAALVESLHDALERLDLATWWFKEEPDWATRKSEEEIRSRIFSAIRDSHMVIFVGSGTSVTSGFVMEEVEFAVSNRVPFLIWYPEGVRICPQEAAEKSHSEQEHFELLLSRLFRPGIYALYGYGLRSPDIRQIAGAVRHRFGFLVSGHPVAMEVGITGQGEDLLCPTRLVPVLIDADGHPLFPRLIR